MLTKKQKELLDYITIVNKKNGISPSYEEMKEKLKLKSKSGIHRIISALEERGFIRKLANKARAIEILDYNKNVTQIDEGTNKNVEIPLYGKIAAGTPIEAISNSSSTISTPSDMLKKGEHYALEISGESMIGSGINNKDIAVIKKTNVANNGQIVVALVDKTEATLKKFKKTSSKIVLMPSNDLYQAQSYESSRVQIQGILVGLMRKY
ncbi:MAG: LexA repressor [Alphaproteobacteria bacterium MarineAlpha9_Bin3]|nr:MAG: LexA repressor [Alphaproteobacteria bacterium MarineAlpha9_Bin3]|tara:strand:- start:25064 stop:25690 length:627 start_codon:yes stop_codon:yes gene_type:complete